MKKNSSDSGLNIIVNGFHEKSLFEAIAAICLDFNVKYVANVFSKKIFPLPKGVKADFFDHEEVIYHANYSIKKDALKPVSKEVLKEMKPVEPIVLEMMGRLERYKPYSKAARKKLFSAHLMFWNTLILDKQINLFITSNVPHLTYDYIVYELCRYYEIPTIIIKQTQVHGTFAIFSSWKELNPEVAENYCAYLKQSKISLSKNFEKQFLKQTGQDPTPFYMRKAGKAARIQRYLKTLLDERRWAHRLKFGSRQLITGSKLALQSKKLSAYYEEVSTAADYSKKYIYLPLHLQPEMTTSPLAGKFADQYLMIKYLSEALPKDIYLYVKENPKQNVLMRSRDYYDRIKKLKQVRLISKKEDTYSLINRSLAVATATGTAGWEALFRGKCVIMFGHDFYQYAPGVVKVNSEADAKRAVKFVKNRKNYPTLGQMRAFLKAYETVCTDGFIDPVYGEASNISIEKNKKNLIRAVENYMFKLGFKKND